MLNDRVTVPRDDMEQLLAVVDKTWRAIGNAWLRDNILPCQSAAILRLRNTTSAIEGPITPIEAALIDGDLLLRNRDGRVVGRWVVKDPRALRRLLSVGVTPAPECSG